MGKGSGVIWRTGHPCDDIGEEEDGGDLELVARQGVQREYAPFVAYYKTLS